MVLDVQYYCQETKIITYGGQMATNLYLDIEGDGMTGELIYTHPIIANDFDSDNCPVLITAALDDVQLSANSDLITYDSEAK